MSLTPLDMAKQAASHLPGHLASRSPDAAPIVSPSDAVAAARDFLHGTDQPRASGPTTIVPSSLVAASTVKAATQAVNPSPVTEAQSGQAEAAQNAAAHAALRAAAAELAKQIGGGKAASTSGAGVGGSEHSGEDAAVAAKQRAAAFAESLKKRAKGVGGIAEAWGGSSALATADDPYKAKQALIVSELQNKLSAFRKDRGVDEPAEKKKLSIKLFIPEPAEGDTRERNWVGILIGRDGINKKRLEQQTGATVYLRGQGTQLRGKKKLGKGEVDEDEEALHVLIEADDQEALDKARVAVMALIMPADPTALALYDEAQLVTMALQKTTNTEECAFCGKSGHTHSQCPKRRTKFTMAGVRCSACGSAGHTVRDCKGDRSKVASLFPTKQTGPSVFEDDDFAAFSAELNYRGSL